jgi:tripartite-type tricarboxylate transporter receptor subunit TctC
MKTAAAVLALLAVAAGAQAQTWPTKTLRWLVPFSAGGPTDAMARDIAAHVSKEIGQTIVIENMGGAGGTIGAGRAANAAPDGYTFLVGHLGYMAAAPSIYKKLAYDPVKDFEPIFRFPDVPLVLLVPKASQFKSAEELIAYAKNNPGKVNFGNAGVGSMSHLVASLFKSSANIDIGSISYKGTAQAMSDLIGGQIDAQFEQTNTSLPQIAGGRVTALALTSTQPMPQFPGVPPLTQKALPGFEAATWMGLYAPKGTPKEVIEKLSKAYIKALKDKAWSQKMSDQGMRILSEAQMSPEGFGRHTAAEIMKWRKVVADANLTVD